MSLIALGWCRSGAPLCGPLTRLGTGPVQVIAAPAALSNPRLRLRLLQDCFDAEIDCVPLSPDHICSVPDAMALAPNCTQDLLLQLDEIAGSGQLTLTMTGPDHLLPRASGRAFLQALHRRSQSIEDAMRALMQAAQMPHVPLARSASGCRVDLLVRREREADLRGKIAHAAHQLPMSDLSLLVTGLWPPLAFVRPPRMPAEATS